LAGANPAQRGVPIARALDRSGRRQIAMIFDWFNSKL
jgi:hypothetical protein